MTFPGERSVSQAPGKKPHPSSLVRLLRPEVVLALLLPGSLKRGCPALGLTAGHCWWWPLLGCCRESTNEGEQDSRDRPEHFSLKQGPNFSKKCLMDARAGQGEKGLSGSGSSVQFSRGCEIYQVCHLFPSTKTCQDALSQNTH